jgi:DNA-binding response OmpR family regulator
MPGTNGIELCHRLQESSPRCQFFLFSGQADTAPLIEEARARGCRWELLAKPVNPRELLAKIAGLASNIGDSMAAQQ